MKPRSRAGQDRPGDRIYTLPSWRHAVTHWRRQRKPCARCGGVIDYDGPRGPNSLDVGHVVDKRALRLAGWTDDAINNIDNTQPEHSRCNRRHGGQIGNAARWGRRPQPITSQPW